MTDFKIISEKTHSIQTSWIILSVSIGSPFIALLISFQRDRFHPIIFIVSLIVIAVCFSAYLLLARKNYHYEFGEKNLILKQGILSKSQRYVQYGRVQNILLAQSVIEKLFGLASITIETASEGGGVKFLKRTRTYASRMAVAFLGFRSNRVGIPGLSYNDAVEIRNAIMQLIKINPIDDAQSGL